MQKQNGIKGREDTGEEHENFMLKGHWYEISDKNVQLAGSHYVGPKWNTGENLKRTSQNG